MNTKNRASAIGQNACSNSHLDLWEGEAPAEPTSNLATSFDSHEISGFGGSLTLPTGCLHREVKMVLLREAGLVLNPARIL